jgi:hypothetical protein
MWMYSMTTRQNCCDAYCGDERPSHRNAVGFTPSHYRTNIAFAGRARELPLRVLAQERSITRFSAPVPLCSTEHRLASSHAGPKISRYLSDIEPGRPSEERCVRHRKRSIDEAVEDVGNGPMRKAADKRVQRS